MREGSHQRLSALPGRSRRQRHLSHTQESHGYGFTTLRVLAVEYRIVGLPIAVQAFIALAGLRPVAS